MSLHRHDDAQPPLPRGGDLAYPVAQPPLRPAGDPMNDETAPRDTKSQPCAPPAPAGARKSDPKAGERLAAALRENLRRRKQQARARRSDADPVGGEGRD